MERASGAVYGRCDVSFVFDAIKDALERLLLAHREGDETAIAKASEELDKLDCGPVVLGALDRRKRESIEVLSSNMESDDIAFAVNLPRVLVDLVIEQMRRDAYAEYVASERRHAEERAAEREHVRRVPCAKCGAAAGRPCVTARGVKSDGHHASRAEDAGRM
jgi:hypothetical protein